MFMKNKIFLIVVAIYFTLTGLFHFWRLAFGLDYSVGNYEIPTILSAICFLFSILLVFLAIKIIKREKNRIDIIEE